MTTLAALPTPSLLVDLARVRRNCARMLAFARESGVRLRPHVKTHKCVEIARLQHGGEIGALTVSTLAEAEHFAAAGFGNIPAPTRTGSAPSCSPARRSISSSARSPLPSASRPSWHNCRDGAELGLCLSDPPWLLRVAISSQMPALTRKIGPKGKNRPRVRLTGCSSPFAPATAAGQGRPDCVGSQSHCSARVSLPGRNDAHQPLEGVPGQPW